jgi:ABC-type uncharacterized transport system substrate-binding protein
MDNTALILTVIASNLVLMITAIGVTITLFLKSDSRIDAALKGISEEMKDFHGRLCKIEERNSARIMQ